MVGLVPHEIRWAGHLPGFSLNADFVHLTAGAGQGVPAELTRTVGRRLGALCTEQEDSGQQGHDRSGQVRGWLPEASQPSTMSAYSQPSVRASKASASGQSEGYALPLMQRVKAPQLWSPAALNVANCRGHSSVGCADSEVTQVSGQVT